MIDPPAVRIPAPVLAAEPSRPGFPVVAVLAPLVMSGVLFAVTGSPFMLLMAALSPVIAVATMLDGRRQRRRQMRDDAARFASDLEAASARAADAQRAERERLAAFAAVEARWSSNPADGVPVAVGRGTVPSGVEIGGVLDDRSSSTDVIALRAEAAWLADAPIVRDARGGVAVDGVEVEAAAVARAIALRVAARLSPAMTTVEAPDDETWARELPHPSRSGPAGAIRFATPEGDVLVSWGSRTVAATHRVSAVTADAMTRAAARRVAARLAEVARTLGIRAADAELPDLVPLGTLLSDDALPGLAAPVGVDADGPVLLDLVADGPHALVAGTTGSGKSELLVSWVLAMASARSPSEVSFVLVDFKGGAAFAPLAHLPHVLGTLSDLDERLARRAIESLRAEVLRRERVLADAGARAIADLPAGALARLVVVVDEFAALVTERPELHALFADLAARGRSLGVHLILCTQRPAGVVRDAVLANVTLRVVLRVADRADSLGLLGDDGAARLPVSPRGRAVLLDGDGSRRLVQLALACDADVASAAAGAERAGELSGVRRPWHDPLPAIIRMSDLPTGEGIPFGLLDLPAEQRQPVAALEPRHGHLLVLGAAGSGVSTALEAIAAGTGAAGTGAAGTGPSARWLPTDPVDLWGALTRALDAPEPGAVLLLDDLDLVLARCDPEHAPDLAELVARLLRETPRHGMRVVAAARRLAGPLIALSPGFGSRLLLRLAGRDEHVLAGGDGATFDPRATPGSGTWEGAIVQVALPDPAPRRRLLGDAPLVVEPPARGELAVVSGRPRELLDRWPDARIRLVGVVDDGTPVVDPGRTVLLGDPDGWQSDWATLARARRDLPIVFHACGIADVRAITRSREVPPPLGPGEVWHVEQGRARRAVLGADAG